MMKLKEIALVLALAIATLSCVSCGPSLKRENYARAVRSGFKKIPESMQIEAWLGEADHFISYSGANVPQHWYTEVLFYGRYTLTMRIVVKTDSAFSEITEVVGEPQFFLREVSEISNAPDGVARGASFAREWKFGNNDWRKINDAKGDFSTIGIIIKKDQPIRDFESYARNTKELRIRIRPEQGDDDIRN